MSNERFTGGNLHARWGEGVEASLVSADTFAGLSGGGGGEGEGGNLYISTDTCWFIGGNRYRGQSRIY